MKNYIYFDELDSTNTYAKTEAKRGAPEGTVIIAGRQTDGYGRMKRRFFSPDLCGLYMSIILRPTLSPERSLYITTAAAVAVAESIEKLSGRKADIKWVNDIYIDGRKVSGILTEAAFSDENSIEYAVLGIGVNISVPTRGYDESIKNIAGALFGNAQRAELRFSLAEMITERFFYYYSDLEGKKFLPLYREKCFLIGRTVRVITSASEYNAEVIGIDDELGLIVKTDNKEITLRTGEVSIKV